MKQLPWLDYSGQTTSELLACKRTHRIDSLLCAFEWGIQAKAGASGEENITDEEHLVLAVMALDREVNNGGYHQFFVNSSHRFVPIIVDCLRRIGCNATVAITEKAIAALGLGVLTADSVFAAVLTEDPDRDQILESCDNEFYEIEEIGNKLFPFIEKHQTQIQLIQGTQPPVQPVRPKRSNASKLYTYLCFEKVTDLSLENLRRVARKVIQEHEIPATDQEIEGAVVLRAFDCALRDNDFTTCETLAPSAFELMREDTMHSVLYRKWIKHLIQTSQLELADTSTLEYLQYLKGCDQSTLSTQNRILFWAAPLQEHRAALPRSVEFFTTNFPDEDLNQPLPSQRFTPMEVPAAKDSTRKSKKK